MDKSEFKEKYIKKHTKKPFIFVSESGRKLCSIDYEREYKKLQKLVEKYLEI